MSRILRIFILGLLFLSAPVSMANAARLNAADLQALLKAHPEILLDFLKEHSEEVLLIAQDGADKKRNKIQWAAWQRDLEVPKYLNTTGRLMRGSATAPVTIVAFSDFSCPYCMKADAEIRKLLQTRGKDVRYVFKYFPVNETPGSMRAVEYFAAASRQEQDRAWAFYDMLFEANERLSKDTEKLLLTLAEKAGLDIKRLQADLTDKQAIKDMLDADLSEAAANSVQGTPVLFVNNLVLRGAPTADQLTRAVDLALTNARKNK